MSFAFPPHPWFRSFIVSTIRGYARKMSIVELVWARDRFKLFNDLETESRHDSFALRGMLWYIITGAIKEGQVFVDDWPMFSHVCCLHPTKVYSSSDRDMLTLTTKNFQDFRPFFISLMNKRKWKTRQGVIMCYVEERIAQLSEEILFESSKANGLFWKSKPLPNYTAYEKENLDYYSEKDKESLAKLPPGLKLGALKPEEAHLVAQQWPYDIPDKEAMFRWLITILPSACIRDSQGQPVGWIVAYSFGTIGAIYVLPKYRGDSVAASLMVLETIMNKTCPTQRFFWVLDDNPMARRFVEKYQIDLKRTDTIAYWLAWTPNGQSEKKSDVTSRL